MNKYGIVIYWSSEDDAFITEVPELPGCMADGNSSQVALASAEIVIQEWLDIAREDGLVIPAPNLSPMIAWGLVQAVPK